MVSGCFYIEANSLAKTSYFYAGPEKIHQMNYLWKFAK